MRSPSVLSFSILCASRPILVSSISIVPSSTHCSIEMRRMWSMMRLAVVDRHAAESCSKASRGGGHGLVDVGEDAEAALRSRRWPTAAAALPIRARTCSTTLRISSSVACMDRVRCDSSRDFAIE